MTKSNQDSIESPDDKDKVDDGVCRSTEAKLTHLHTFLCSFVGCARAREKDPSTAEFPILRGDRFNDWIKKFVEFDDYRKTVQLPDPLPLDAEREAVILAGIVPEVNRYLAD